MDAIAIEAVRLTKKFGELKAVDGVSFQVARGEFFGLLGPNGAGKTTLMRIFTTLITPTEGKAFVAGLDVVREPHLVRSCIGVVPQAMTTDMELTAWENMDIYGRYYGIPNRERRDRIEYLLDLVGLTNRAKDLVGTYSGGMRRRLEIARGLIHRPSILFLDEPTIGLDPQSRRVVWDLLERFRKEMSLTIILTTHYMDEADALCDRVAIIDYGKIVVMGPPEDLKRQIPGRDIVQITMEENPENVIQRLEELPQVHKIIAEDSLLNLYVDDGAGAIPLLMEKIKEEKGKVSSITLRQQSLEDVFIHYTGRSVREEEVKKVSRLWGLDIRPGKI